MLDLQLIYQYGTTIVLVFALIILFSLFYFTNLTYALGAGAKESQYLYHVKNPDTTVSC